MREVTRELERRGADDKHELLFRHGVNFATLPDWQRRGVGLRWERYEKGGFNPKTGQTVLAWRRRVALVDALPMKDAYDAFLRHLLAEHAAQVSPDSSERSPAGAVESDDATSEHHGDV